MSKAYLNAQEVQRLEGAATNLRDRLLVRVLSHLGCRVSEALALEVKDIDFSRGTATIQHLKSRTQLACPKCGAKLGKSHTFCPKCGERVEEAVARALEHKRVRTLPLDAETLDILKDYIRRGGPVRKGDRDFIFGISRHRAWQIVKEYAERAGLPKLANTETGRVHNVSPHRLRDAFAVNALTTDGSAEGQRFLQEHLGHQSFNTTARYRKVAGEELKMWYDRLWKEKEGDKPNGTPAN